METCGLQVSEMLRYAASGLGGGRVLFCKPTYQISKPQTSRFRVEGCSAVALNPIPHTLSP